MMVMNVNNSWRCYWGGDRIRGEGYLVSLSCIHFGWVSQTMVNVLQ